jgi:hypothetical protein
MLKTPKIVSMNDNFTTIDLIRINENGSLHGSQ